MNMAAFLAYSIVMTFTPGPTNVVILSTAQRRGTRKALEFAAGAALAFGVLLTLAALLSGALLDAAPRIGQGMGIAGAAYMLYLAYTIWTAPDTDSAPERAEAGVGEERGGMFLPGFAMQFMNPKVVMFALTVSSNFLAPHAASPLQVGGLVALVTAIGCCAFLSWVLLGALLRRFLHAYRRQANLVMALFLGYCAFAVSGLPSPFNL